MVSAGRTRIVCAVLSFLGFIPLVAEAVPDPRLRVPPFVPEQRRTLQQLQLTNGGEFVSRDYAPVPEASKGPPMPSGQGYRVEELGSGAYMVTDGVAQIMVVVGEGVTVLVNAPDTLALLERGEDGLSDSLLPEIIRAIVPSPVTHIIYTHSHLVHIGAAGPVVAAFREEADLEIVALEETAQVISALNDYSEQNGLGRRVPEPTLTFATSYTLTDAAGRTLLQLEQMAPAHDRGILRVIHPDSGTLYVVDVIWPGWAPFQGFATSGDVLGFVMSHYVVLDLFDNHNISTIIGGRTNLKGDRSHVATQLAYVEDIVATVRSIMDPEGDNFITEDLVERLQVTVPGHPHFGNMWLVTGVFFEEVASRCERTVLSKLGVAGLPIGTRWTDVLAAADVFTRDTCWAMAIADRIDMHGAALAQPYVLP